MPADRLTWLPLGCCCDLFRAPAAWPCPGIHPRRLLIDAFNQPFRLAEWRN
jgi:hypothetical protein